MRISSFRAASRGSISASPFDGRSCQILKFDPASSVTFGGSTFAGVVHRDSPHQA